MKVRTLVPCRAAELNPDGTASAIGIIDFLWGETFPRNFGFQLLVAVESEAGEAGTVIEPAIEIVDADGMLLWRAQLRIEAGTTGEDGSRWVRYLAIPVSFGTERPGEHEIRVEWPDGAAALGMSVVKRVPAKT